MAYSAAGALSPAEGVSDCLPALAVGETAPWPVHLDASGGGDERSLARGDRGDDSDECAGRVMAL